MTTVTLPTEATPPGSPDTAPWLPLTGHYAVAPGRSLVELTAFYGPLPVRRRRLALAEASLTVSEGTEHPPSASSSPAPISRARSPSTTPVRPPAPSS
jgi:hypothetical protein